MKFSFNENREMVIEVNSTLSITLGAGEADYTYRSHINGMQVSEPNKWVSCAGTGGDGKNYTAWYYVEDTNMELDNIDYDNPDDIEDENGNIIYDKRA